MNHPLTAAATSAWRRWGRAALCLSFVGCGRQAPARPATATATATTTTTTLCGVVARVIDHGNDNFRNQVDATVGSSPSQDVPPGASQASYEPCCASAAAESGPWTWTAAFGAARSLDQLVADLQRCPFASAMTREPEQPGQAGVAWILQSVEITVAVGREGPSNHALYLSVGFAPCKGTGSRTNPRCQAITPSP